MTFDELSKMDLADGGDVGGGGIFFTCKAPFRDIRWPLYMGEKKMGNFGKIGAIDVNTLG